jgi:tetratricopeptide (TPR) repeat protein
VRIAFAMILLAAPAAAQPDEAKALFEQGRALAAAADFEGACAKFARSFELDPAPGTELNLADCQVHLGHVARAWQLFDDAAQRWSRLHDQREKYAREHADALTRQLGSLIVHVAEPDRPGLVIAIAGQPAAAAPEIRELVDPGPVDVVATAPGATTISRAATVAAGEVVTIDLPAFSAPAAPAHEAPSGRRRGRLYLAAGLAGAGAIALVTSAVVGLDAYSDYTAQFGHGCTEATHTCTDPTAHAIQVDAAHRGDIATYIAVGGGLLAAAGVAVYVTAPGATTLAVRATPTSAAIAISGRF